MREARKESEEKEMSKVLLIAGHGKNYNGTTDPGATSVFGREADYCRELVTMVRQAVDDAAALDVYDMDKNCYSYSKAGQVPNYGAYALAIEIHFNAKEKKDESGDGKFSGIGAYVYPGNKGRAVADSIINAVAGMGFAKWQIADSTDLLNLNNAQKAGIKYLLLETAFLDDRDDMDWYNSNKAAVARIIAREIIKAAGGNASAGTPVLPTVPGGSEGSGYAAGMYKIVSDELNIRKGPGTNYDVVGSIKDHGTYTIVETAGSWGRLKSGAGWINCSTAYCTRVGDAGTGAGSKDSTTPMEVWVKTKDLRIRKGPGTGYGIYGYCPVGVYNIVETVQADGHTWGRLKSGAGWVALEYVQRL